MAGRSYPLEPKEVSKVETANRRIVTEIPPKGSIPILQDLRKYEPVSMSGQPPVVWDRAEGAHVHDAWGNRWLDWSSGVLVASAGHGRKEIVEAIVKQAQHGLLHSYCFPNKERTRLAKMLVELAPDPLKKCFLLTTGSEATENTIKLSRQWGLRKRKKNVVITFEGSFHGRTLAAQYAGGIPSLKEWIGELDARFFVVPYPGDWRQEDKSFGVLLKGLEDAGLKAESICGVMTETYQGGSASFMPVEYARELREWCTKNDVLLTFDEIQAGFGRTGTMFGFEHYGLVPDIAVFGKGITSSLPLSAVLGREDVMNQFPAGSMTSTHTGNPICCEAARANLEVVVKEKLHERAAEVGGYMQEKLRALAESHADVVGHADGRGMVAALQLVKKGTTDPDGDLAWDVVARCVEKGLLMFSPVGLGGAAVKIAPPLVTTKEQIDEGVEVLEEAMKEALAARS